MRWVIIDVKTVHEFSLIVLHNDIKRRLICEQSTLVRYSAFEEE